LEDCIMAFQAHYETIAEPFQWKFTRDHLKNLLAKLSPIKIKIKYAQAVESKNASPNL